MGASHIPALGDRGGLVCPRRGGRPLDEKRLRALLKKNRIAAVPHGVGSGRGMAGVTAAGGTILCVSNSQFSR